MNKLEKILRETPPAEKPSADFSSAVMKSVYSEAEENAVREASLEQLLRQLPAEKTSADFALQVMQEVSKSSNPRPLLGLWSRVAIGIFVVLALAGSYLRPAETSEGTLAWKFSSVPALNIPPVYAFTILGMGILLLMDYMIRRRKVRDYN